MNKGKSYSQGHLLGHQVETDDFIFCKFCILYIGLSFKYVVWLSSLLVMIVVTPNLVAMTIVHWSRHPVASLPSTYVGLEKWLEERWREKEARLEVVFTPIIIVIIFVIVITSPSLPCLIIKPRASTRREPPSLQSTQPSSSHALTLSSRLEFVWAICQPCESKYKGILIRGCTL